MKDSKMKVDEKLCLDVNDKLKELKIRKDERKNGRTESDGSNGKRY